MKIIVLGCGLVGSAIVKDLSKEPGFSVTAADRSAKALNSLIKEKNIACIQADLSDPEILSQTVAPFDFVIGALPGFMGFAALKTVIEAGKNTVDISFFPEDPFQLDALAKEKNVTAIVDCGLAPGLGNILLGYHDALFDETSRFLCYVGGLPSTRKKPYEYAAVFSPIDVIEEYTRPARYIENGKEVVMPALSDVEQIDFAGIGTLEAFNTDGLRSIAVTIKAPCMKEKTMRYPGHVDLMRIFRDTGFFSKELVEINGQHIRPLDLTAKLLFPAWKLLEGEEDFSVMRVIIEGKENGKDTRYTYDLLDRFDNETNETSMARTTGYTCAVAARLLINGSFTRKGICPPEYLGQDKDVFSALMDGLGARNIQFDKHVEIL